MRKLASAVLVGLFCAACTPSAVTLSSSSLQDPKQPAPTRTDRNDKDYLLAPEIEKAAESDKADPAPTPAPDEDARTEAQRLLEEAQKLDAAGEHEKALELFKQALKLLGIPLPEPSPAPEPSPEPEPEPSYCAKALASPDAFTDEELIKCAYKKELGGCYITDSCETCACSHYVKLNLACDAKGSCGYPLEGTGCTDYGYYAGLHGTVQWDCKGDGLITGGCMLRRLTEWGYCEKYAP